MKQQLHILSQSSRKVFFFLLLKNKIHKLAFLFFISLFSFTSSNSFAQTTGDYRTAGTGPSDWNNISSWQRFDGTSWIAATVTPNGFNSNVVTIQNGHTIDVTANTFVDQLIISTTGQLNILTGVNFNLLNGSGVDLECFGTLAVTGSLDVTAGGASAEFRNGSTLTVNNGSLLNGTVTIDNGCSFSTTGTSTSTASIVSGTNFIVGGSFSLSNLYLNNNTVTLTAGAQITATGSNSFFGAPSGVIVVNGGGTATINAVNSMVSNGILNVTNISNLVLNAGNLLGDGTINVDNGSAISGGSPLNFTGISITNNGVINLDNLTFGGSFGQSISGANGQIKSLTINNVNNVNMFGDVVVNETLALNVGRLNTNFPNVLKLADAVVVTASAFSYVNGDVQRNILTPGTKFFPVGNASRFAPVTLDPSFTVGGQVTVKTDNIDHPNINTSSIDATKSVNRFWTITNNGLTFTECDITFDYLSSDKDAGTNDANFVLGKYNAPNWTLPAGVISSPNSLYVANVTSFGAFQIGEPICNVNIPDANFKTYLLAQAAINTNGDGEIQCSEAAAFTGAINVPSLSISSLVGIEAFTALTALDCSNNNLTTLDVSANTNLQLLFATNSNISNFNFTPNANYRTIAIGNNPITGNLNLSACTGLISLQVANTTLTSLTLPTTATLTNLQCQNSGISTLNVSGNTGLQFLFCNNNNLTSLDVSSNTNLIQLNCETNSINSFAITPNATLQNLRISTNQIAGTLDLSASTNLSNLSAANNQLTAVILPTTNTLQAVQIQGNLITNINTTGNPNLITFAAGSNRFTNINLSANTNLSGINVSSSPFLTTLNIANGNNSNLLGFSAIICPLLTCIQVSDVAYMNTNWAAGKDASATYSLTCPLNTQGAALIFDGVDDKVTVINSTANLTNKSFSVEMWLKLNSTNTYDVAFSQGNSGVDNQLLHIGFSSTNKFIFNFFGGPNDFEVAITPDLSWHHWACTFDNVTKERKIYKDGVLIGQAVIPSTFVGNAAITHIGANGYAGDEFDGSIDELRVWNGVRTQAQISATMLCELPYPNYPNLQSYYPFNQGIATANNPLESTLNDQSGNSNNGTLTSFALTGATSNWKAPSAVVTGTICCTVTLSTSANDTLFICAESGQTTGSVTLLAIGGVAPYTYGGSPTTNLAPGTYTYTVTDANGCKDTTTLNVQVVSCIIPYYKPPVNGLTDSLIGSELTQLYQFPASLADTTFANNIFLFKKDTISGDTLILIEVIVLEGNYNTVLSLLSTATYGMRDFVDNGDSTLIITGFIPIRNLKKLNALPNLINYARPYFTPIASGNTGLTTTQGDKAMRSDKAKEAWKITGKGAKLGVLSDSYNTKFGNPAALDVLNGDLPGNTNPIHKLPVKVSAEYPYGRATDEGRAMLQIAHDVAPDAELHFRSGFISAGNMADGIRTLRDSGCNVIVDDITYLTEPFLSDGLIAKAVDDVTSTGVNYFTSAGNFGVKSYEADFSPTTPPSRFSTATAAHNFGSSGYYQPIKLTKGTYTLVMQWNDAFYSVSGVNGLATGASSDFDIFMVAASGDSSLFGFNRNNLMGDPIEVMPFVVTKDVDANIVITRKSGTSSARIKFILFRGEGTILNNTQGTSTVVGQANAASAISVGAVLYTNTPQFGNTPSVASFSSRGGTLIDGVNRLKPDITAPNGVNATVNFGGVNIDNDLFPNFFGTSAAAPHAAAVAALVLEAKNKFIPDSNFTGNVMKTLLQQTAIDMDAPGYDVNSGFGFIQADAALQSFSNPFPIVDSIYVQNPNKVPGVDTVTVVLNGEYFSNNAAILFRYDTIATSVSNDGKQLTASIPPFMG